MADSLCAVAGCGVERRARGWCSRHYTRYVRYGDAAYRMPGEVRDGKRICSICHVDTDLSTMNGSWCNACTAARKRARSIKKERGIACVCVICRAGFLGWSRTAMTCSKECRVALAAWDSATRERDLEALADARIRWVAANRPAVAATEQRRWQRMQAGLPTFTRRDILERDGWLCQLCMQPIPRDVPARSPVAATVDHIVPLARGGSHEPTNCQAAHRQCNTRKGTRLTMPKGAGPHFG